MKKSRSFLAYAVFFAACLLLPAALHAQQGSMDWTQATDSAGWSGRCNHTSVVFDNKMWVIGGELRERCLVLYRRCELDPGNC
jgi:hypothetical protein